jgi:hypothetical protein
MERLVVVLNPNSTRAKRVQSGVLDRLNDSGHTHDTLITKYPDTEANIDTMLEFFRNGDTILTAAGDGTAMQAMNAVLRTNLENTRIGPLGYGNFQDIGREQDPLKLLSTEPIAWNPMTLKVNGDYFRHAPAYATFGLTALAASKFGGQSSRNHMRHTPDKLRLLSSIGQLGIDYFALRRHKLPPFTTNLNNKQQNIATDIFAINSPRAGRIIRLEEDYSASNDFGFHISDLSRIWPNVPFGIQASTGHAPTTPMQELIIRFEEPSTIPLQTEGEFAIPSEVEAISIHKDPTDVLRVLKST